MTAASASPVRSTTVRSGISPARYMTVIVLPVPGGPWSSSPRLTWRPVARRRSRCFASPAVWRSMRSSAMSGSTIWPRVDPRQRPDGQRGGMERVGAAEGDDLAAVDVVLLHQPPAGGPATPRRSRAAGAMACSCRPPSCGLLGRRRAGRRAGPRPRATSRRADCRQEMTRSPTSTWTYSTGPGAVMPPMPPPCASSVRPTRQPCSSERPTISGASPVVLGQRVEGDLDVDVVVGAQLLVDHLEAAGVDAQVVAHADAQLRTRAAARCARPTRRGPGWRRRAPRAPRRYQRSCTWARMWRS